MASTARRRVNSDSERNRIRTVEDGNAVRQVYVYEKKRHKPHKPSRTPDTVIVSSQVKKNRARAKNIGAGYVAFLTAACLATMFLCLNYLQLKSELTTQRKQIAAAESELSTLKADNDAYYNQVISSVTLEDVKEAALNRLGMHYATESQIEYYSTGDSSYLRQYQDVPE